MQGSDEAMIYMAFKKNIVTFPIFPQQRRKILLSLLSHMLYGDFGMN
jgi:hypothetical protein